MASDRRPRFRPGDRVRVRNLHPTGHIRAPRYTRGRTGQVFAYHGVHVFADANAHGRHVGEPLYGVRFTARELWGEDGCFVESWFRSGEALDYALFDADGRLREGAAGSL